MTTYVRGRNGGWHVSPVFVFPEGFMHFDEQGVELVLWMNDKREHADIPHTIRCVLGDRHGVVSVGPIQYAQRPVPAGGNAPPVFHAAAYVALELKRRIPEPTMSEGCERRLSRISEDVHSMDFEPDSNDPYELRVYRPR